MTENIRTDFWFFEPNLVPVLLLLSHIIKYDFDSSDLDAIKYGLTSSSREKNLWWAYQLIGEKTIDMQFARDDDNTDIIFIQLTFDKALAPQVELCVFMVQDFFISHRHYHTDLKIYE